MFKKINRYVLVLLFLGYFFLNLCYSSNYDGISVQVPPGWNDNIFDKLAKGKSLKVVLAVLDFEGNEKLKDEVDLKMSDMLTTALVKSNKFDVVERNKLEKILGEQKLNASGAVDSNETVAKIGSLAGAEAVVFGTISSATEKKEDKFSYDLVTVSIEIDVRAINTTTGKIILSEKAEGDSSTKIFTTADGTVVDGALNFNSLYSAAARNAVDNIGAKIADLFPLIGFVADVDSDNKEVTLDIGSERGIKTGDIFILCRKGKEIIHPITKEHIGWKKEAIAAIVIETNENKMATGKIVKFNSSKVIPQQGDIAISLNTGNSNK